MMALDWAYLAGFLDGEGCIDSFTIQQRPTYVIRIRASNSHDPVTVKWIHQTFGGNLRVRKGYIYVWETAGKRAAWILKNIQPYLKLKQPQAEVALAIWLRRQNKPHHLHRRLSELKRENRTL